MPFTYFSIDLFSATNGFGLGDIANDILISDATGGFGIFAEGVSDIGLQTGDDLDALVLRDVFQPGVLNPGEDIALFSISTFSTSAFFTASPADILFTDFTGGFSLWASANDIGLRFDDEVDALDTVPEPATILLMTLGLVGIALNQYRLRRKRLGPETRGNSMPF